MCSHSWCEHTCSKTKKQKFDFQAGNFEFEFDSVPKKVFFADKSSKFIVVPHQNIRNVLEHGRIDCIRKHVRKKFNRTIIQCDLKIVTINYSLNFFHFFVELLGLRCDKFGITIKLMTCNTLKTKTHLFTKK